MALPSLDNPQDKGQVQEIVADIATAVFKSAKVSMESAAKAVIPSVPDMVDEVLKDLQSGSVRTFNLALDKLDKLVQKLGIDLKDYSKELANFQTKREEKLIKSETKIQALKEKNIIATIEKSGDIKILSQTEIRTRQDNLRALEKNIAEMEKSLEKDRKLLQENNKLKTTAQANKKQEILEKSAKLEENKQKADDERQVLGSRGEEQPGIFQRGREGVSNFVDEYVPTPIADVGSAFVEGLMGPVNAVKELGSVFGGLLKPLKLLKPLFTGLIGGLKKFALGLKAAFVSMLPYIAIVALVGLALYGLYKVYKKLFPDINKTVKENVEERAKKQADAGNLRQSNNITESVKEKPEFLDSRGTVIQFGKAQTVEEIEKGFKPQTEMPEAFKKEIRPGSYYDKIQKLNKSSSNFMNPENRTNLQVPKELTPPEETKKEPVTNVSQINDNSSNNSSSPIIGGGLNGVSNRDFQNHILQTV